MTRRHRIAASLALVVTQPGVACTSHPKATVVHHAHRGPSTLGLADPVTIVATPPTTEEAPIEATTSSVPRRSAATHPEGVASPGQATGPAPSGPPSGSSTRGAGGETGSATVSWYGPESGAVTANGERFDPDGLTFASRTLAFGTRIRFCRGGACVVATCTDRGPASWTGRDFDLSRGAFATIAPLSTGVADVTWEAA